MAEAIDDPQAAGRDRSSIPANIPSFVDRGPEATISLLWTYCRGANNRKGTDDTARSNFKYGMKRDFNAWLAYASGRSARERR